MRTGPYQTTTIYRKLARTAVVLAVVIGSGGVALAAPKTDIVVLANGDHFTVEIVRLSRGRLEVKTDDVGTLDIEWDKIVSVQAIAQFDVTTTDGRRFLGSLGRAGAREVVIETAAGPVSLTTSEITELAPIGASFWKKLDGSFDAGFTYTRSSGIATTTLNSDTAFRRPASLARLTASATLTSQSNDGSSDDRAAIDMSYTRYRGRRWYFGGAGRLETNESLGLVLRSQIAALTGLRLVNTNRAQFQVGAGVSFNDEQALDAPGSQNIEGVLSMSSSYYTYDRPKTNVDTRVTYYPSLSNWGRQRLQLDSGVRRELLKDFFCSLEMYDSFDSAPPNPDAHHNDVGVVIGIGWSY